MIGSRERLAKAVEYGFRQNGLTWGITGISSRPQQRIEISLDQKTEEKFRKASIR